MFPLLNFLCILVVKFGIIVYGISAGIFFWQRKISWVFQILRFELSWPLELFHFLTQIFHWLGILFLCDRYRIKLLSPFKLLVQAFWKCQILMRWVTGYSGSYYSYSFLLVSYWFHLSQDIGFSQKQHKLIVRSTTGPIDVYLLRYLYQELVKLMHQLKLALIFIFVHLWGCISKLCRPLISNS